MVVGLKESIKMCDPKNQEPNVSNPTKKPNTYITTSNDYTLDYRQPLHPPMGIRNLKKISRFFSIPHSCSTLLSSHFFSNTPSSITLFQSSSSILFSTGCSPFYSFKTPFEISSSNIISHIGLQFLTQSYFCSYPYKGNNKPYATSKQVSQIIALIIESVNDLEFRLNTMNVKLSMSSVSYISEMLANKRVSALLFFDWLKVSHSELCCDPEIGGLVVNNCGLLGNYEAMVLILNEFNLKKTRLGSLSFRFLLVLGLDKDSTMECVSRVVSVLNEVGGVCQSSGIQLLIEMFSFSDSFDVAEFVIRTAGRKVNHYNFLLRKICERGEYERAGELVKEMKRSGLDPNKSTYNLLVSWLFKNGKFSEACRILETMEKEYGLPDEFTFDVLISLLCKQQQLDLALKFLDKMTLKGIEPSILTHAVVIKTYFESRKYDEAHKYVVDYADKHSYSSNANYSLLASLYLKKGNVLLAQRILYEMMNKSLKPNFSVYMKIRKCLEKKNEKDLSLELSRRYLNLIEK